MTEQTVIQPVNLGKGLTLNDVTMQVQTDITNSLGYSETNAIGVIGEQIKDWNATVLPGWYTIAYISDRYKQDGTSSGIKQRAYASFIINEVKGGQHQTVHFDAGHHYGRGNFINILGMSSYDYPSNVIQQMRIIGKGTYDGALLQIYIKTTSKIDRIKMYNNLAISGWVLCPNPILSGSDVEETELLSDVRYLSSMTQKCNVYLHNDYVSMIASGDMRCKNIDVSNGILISNRTTSTNIDHLWHDDSTNTWYANSDATYKSKLGNSNFKVGNLKADSIQIGDSAPRITRKKITGVYNSTANATKNFAHGLTMSKIIKVDIVVRRQYTNIFPCNPTPKVHFVCFNNEANVVIQGVDDELLLNEPLDIYITYEV